tara:strand:+ start:15884 stop:16105 length:222 start_codon:yes stop_codon:yes gene_type:complete
VVANEISVYLTTTLSFLDRGAFHRSIAAVHATVSFFWFYDLVTVFAFIEILTGVSGHYFLFLMPAAGAGDGGF